MAHLSCEVGLLCAGGIVLMPARLPSTAQVAQRTNLVDFILI
jgi:hypothetical protein